MGNQKAGHVRGPPRTGEGKQKPQMIGAFLGPSFLLAKVVKKSRPCQAPSTPPSLGVARSPFSRALWRARCPWSQFILRKGVVEGAAFPGICPKEQCDREEGHRMLALNASESEACLILQLTMAKSFTVSEHQLAPLWNGNTTFPLPVVRFE